MRKDHGYSKTFLTKEDWLEADVVELEMNGLDSMAKVFFNGVYLGQHPSAFRPFIKDISNLLKDQGEENKLVVRLTSGLEYFSQQDISDVAPYVSIEKVGGRGDKRRVYVCKPQYSFGWDWNPRVPTCGITGDVKIKLLKTAVIRDVHVITELEEDRAWLNFNINVELLDWIGTNEGNVMVEVIDKVGNSLKINKEVFLRSGYNYVYFKIELENPSYGGLMVWVSSISIRLKYQQ